MGAIGQHPVGTLGQNYPRRSCEHPLPGNHERLALPEPGADQLAYVGPQRRRAHDEVHEVVFLEHPPLVPPYASAATEIGEAAGLIQEQLLEPLLASAQPARSSLSAGIKISQHDGRVSVTSPVGARPVPPPEVQASSGRQVSHAPRRTVLHMRQQLGHIVAYSVMAAVEGDLAARGVPTDRIHSESFGPAAG